MNKMIMKIKKIVKYLCLGLCLLAINFTLFNCNKKQNIIEKFPKKINELTSYKLVGKLESIYPTGTKESEIMVLYQKPNLYRVEIKNANVEESQVIIKNGDGVFVVVPLINKSFKVNTSWPLNSSYPYLLQSLSKDIISDENIVATSEEGKTILELKTTVHENAKPTKQKITFDNKTCLPTEVLVYDSQDNLLSRLVILSIEENTKLENDLFLVNQTINTMRLNLETTPVVFERIISYPSYYVEGTSMVDEVITGDQTTKQVIMKYGGTTAFTIIEQYVNDETTLKTEYIDGDLYVMGGVVGVINNTSLKFYENGIEYTLASNSIDMIELIKTGESLRIIDEK